MDVEATHNTPPERRQIVAERPPAIASVGEGNNGVTAGLFGKKDWLAAIALVAAVFLVYVLCWHGGFLFDDELHLLNNPVLKPGGLAKVWVPGGYLNYWPLTYTAYWLQFHLWGLKPLGFHLVNLALHALSAILVWRVLVRLEVPGALFAAAIFALHPVNVETAAWIAHLKDILALALALVSMLLYLDSERYGSRWRYALAIAAFLLSALAKGTAVTLPIVLLACAWWRRGWIGWRDLLRVMPYFLIGAVMSGIEVWMQHSVELGDVVRTDDLQSRLAVAGCAVWFYLGKMILPFSLCPVYPRWSIDERSVLSCLPGVMWLIVLGVAWWKQRIWGRPVVMLMICYAALLLPILGFANIYFMRFSLVSDHWQYIATIVPCAMFAGMATTLARRLLIQRAAVTAAISLLAGLGILTVVQSRIYADGETFYTAILAQNPDCWMAHLNLGLLLEHDGRLDAAMNQYQQALDIKPDYVEAHNDLGKALLTRKQTDAATAHFRAALAIKPNYPLALNNLGLVFASRGDTDLAISHFRRALEMKPDYADAHNNLGNALLSRREFDAAVAEFQQALEINPDYAEAEYDLGNALLGGDQVEAAVAHYQRALDLNPNYVEAHDNLATALASRGEFDSAIVQFETALEIKPGNTGARRNLAVVRSEREKIVKNLAQQRSDLLLRPDDATLLKDIAWTLATNPNASIRNGAEAVELAKRASKLSGGNDPALLHTLAAAYAEAGRFPDAVRTEKQAERLASSTNNRTLQEQIRICLDLYKDQKPLRQAPAR